MYAHKSQTLQLTQTLLTQNCNTTIWCRWFMGLEDINQCEKSTVLGFPLASSLCHPHQLHERSWGETWYDGALFPPPVAVALPFFQEQEERRGRGEGRRSGNPLAWGCCRQRFSGWVGQSHLQPAKFSISRGTRGVRHMSQPFLECWG